MPSPFFLELSEFDPEAIIATREEIYRVLPQRFEFEQLHGATHFDRERGIGVAFRHITLDDWWVRGHIPGRPIFPGALMLEAAAQAAAYFVGLMRTDKSFIAFGGVDQCKFRSAVVPPAKMFFICKLIENRPRRFIGDLQGVVNGELVFEARVAGLAMAK